MPEDQIEVNAWVVLARSNPCCGQRHKHALPIPYQVTSIAQRNGICGGCGRIFMNLQIAYGYGGKDEQGLPFMLLKRLPDPPAPIEPRTVALPQPEEVS